MKKSVSKFFMVSSFSFVLQKRTRFSSFIYNNFHCKLLNYANLLINTPFYSIIADDVLCSRILFSFNRRRKLITVQQSSQTYREQYIWRLSTVGGNFFFLQKIFIYYTTVTSIAYEDIEKFIISETILFSPLYFH